MLPRQADSESSARSTYRSTCHREGVSSREQRAMKGERKLSCFKRREMIHSTGEAGAPAKQSLSDRQESLKKQAKTKKIERSGVRAWRGSAH